MSTILYDKGQLFTRLRLRTGLVGSVMAADENTNSPAAAQAWNWHVQNTDIVQGYPEFPADYTHGGFNSLPNGGEVRETVSLDLTAGIRLWSGAELHADGMMWQGFGLNNARGVDGFPNGEAFRVGTQVPDGQSVPFLHPPDHWLGR